MTDREISKLGSLYIIDEYKEKDESYIPLNDYLTSYKKFGFGKYKGKTIKYVFENDTPYLGWCIKTIKRFIVSEEELSRILQRLSTKWNFKNSKIKEIEEANNLKRANVYTGLEELGYLGNEPDCYDYSDDDDFRYEEEETYGNYAGSYVQGEMGYSDNFINDVLEGNPDLYWNID